MICLGLDPGASGGLGAITLGDLIEGPRTYVAEPWPETEADMAHLVYRYNQLVYRYNRRPVAVIERVHSMPKQGVASSFKFGRHYGFLRGLLVAYGIPFVEVNPQTWQKALGCLSHGDKNITKTRAQQLAPDLKFTHRTADAFLLAIYCSRLDWTYLR